jgi:hypothetical protein
MVSSLNNIYAGSELSIPADAGTQFLTFKMKAHCGKDAISMRDLDYSPSITLNRINPPSPQE